MSRRPRRRPPRRATGALPPSGAPGGDAPGRAALGENTPASNGGAVSDPGTRPERRRGTRPAPPKIDAAALVHAMGEGFETIFLDEPDLLFGERRSAEDPKTGLGLYGPYDLDDPSRPARIRLGVIGPGAMIDLTRRWLERCQKPVKPVRRVKQADGLLVPEAMDPIAYPPFPGLEAVFHTPFVIVDAMCETLSAAEIADVKRLALYEERVTRLVQLLVKHLHVLAEKAARPDVVLCVLPTELRGLCTVASRHLRRGNGPMSAAALLRADLARDAERGQDNLFDVAAANRIALDDDAVAEHIVLHHGLKARAMEIGIPTQLIWQGTLDGSAILEDDATRAWNLWTGVYFKAGGTPWRVSGLDAGTCFVGVSFYRDQERGAYRTSLAQAFSDRGDGIVLRSDPFRWDSTRSPHLPHDQARALLNRVMRAYQEHLHHPPSRVVVHKWQRYTPEERTGFEQAIADAGVHSADLVAFGDRGLRFFRVGEEPPLRGTTILLSPSNALLYTRGYVPYLAVYPGMRVPRPLEITEHHGSAALTQICREILALTKMDWNSAAFAGKAPITTAFAEDVGHILAEIPVGRAPKPNYRFYM